MWRCSVKSLRPLQPLFRPFWIGGQSARRPKLRLKLKLATLLFVMILALPGCISLTQPTSNTANNPTVITKPTLTSLRTTESGGITMNKHDAEELLFYIEALERAAGIEP